MCVIPAKANEDHPWDVCVRQESACDVAGRTGCVVWAAGGKPQRSVATSLLDLSCQCPAEGSWAAVLGRQSSGLSSEGRFLLVSVFVESGTATSPRSLGFSQRGWPRTLELLGNHVDGHTSETSQRGGILF